MITGSGHRITARAILFLFLLGDLVRTMLGLSTRFGPLQGLTPYAHEVELLGQREGAGEFSGPLPFNG